MFGDADKDKELTKEEKQLINDVLGATDKDFTRPQRHHGGLITPMSQCCGAPLQQTTGGVIMDYCPKCGRLS